MLKSSILSLPRDDRMTEFETTSQTKRKERAVRLDISQMVADTAEKDINNPSWLVFVPFSSTSKHDR